MNNRKATFFKVVGGNFGAMRVSNGTGFSYWAPMPCLHCARVDHPNLFTGPRARSWQGPPSKPIEDAMRCMVGIDCKNSKKHKKSVQLVKEHHDAQKH